MDRRTFLCVMAVGAIGSPPISRIGVLMQLTPEESAQAIVGLREGLRENGQVEGQNIGVEWRWAKGDVKLFPDLATDLVRLRVDVIVATVNRAVQAARAATLTIPIVMVVPSDPVGLGFVRSLARPGGNITGLTWQTREAVPKRLQLLKETIPNLTRVAVLWDPTEPARRLQVEEAKRAASAIGVQVRAFEARDPEAIEGAFVAMAYAGVGAVLVEASAMLGTQRKHVADLAVKHRLATIGWWKGMAEDGCLLSYSPSVREQYRRAAYFVTRILNGAKPADLPVEQPTKFELVINMKTAMTLGLTIPPSLLLRADQVIE
jgi:putative ABC transport system substrate-binding protein